MVSNFYFCFDWPKFKKFETTTQTMNVEENMSVMTPLEVSISNEERIKFLEKTISNMWEFQTLKNKNSFNPKNCKPIDLEDPKNSFNFHGIVPIDIDDEAEVPQTNSNNLSTITTKDVEVEKEQRGGSSVEEVSTDNNSTKFPEISKINDHFYFNTRKPVKFGKWEENEVEELLELIKGVSIPTHWGLLSLKFKFGDRTGQQLRDKFKHLTEKTGKYMYCRKTCVYKKRKMQ